MFYGMLVGCGIGLIIGVAIGIWLYLRMQRINSDIISQIDELTKDTKDSPNALERQGKEDRVTE